METRIVIIAAEQDELSIDGVPNVPPEVRLPDGMVEMRGLEPLTPAMRTQCSPS